jgi:phosphoglucan,water dikinase
MQDPELYRRALEEVKRIEAARGKPEVEVRFSIPFSTKFGESVLVTGNHEKLGSWVGDKALELRWSEGNVWRGELFMQESPNFEYKYVCAGQTSVRWEEGPNRKIADASLERHGSKRIYIAEDEWRN